MDGRIYTIDEIKKAVTPIAREYGVKRVSLFGSYARGDATDKSDIDIHLIDSGEIKGYFALAGFQQDLQNSLGTNVDVLTSGALSDKFLERISKEEILLYERN